MLFDDGVDLGHEADRLLQGDDDLVVVGDVVGAEGAALAVFEPLFADLISISQQATPQPKHRKPVARTRSLAPASPAQKKARERLSASAGFLSFSNGGGGGS